MSPLLFDIVVDALSIILDKAKHAGYVRGVLSELGDNGVNMLQYADATIFLLKDDEDRAKNLKSILTAFEQMSGLIINFHKSEVYLFGEAKKVRSIKKYLPVTKERFPSNIWDCLLPM